MRQSAKLKAAEDILDMLIFGEMSSKKIINWERKNKYAGSKDRRNIRDIVYHCLRNKSYFSHPWINENNPVSGRNLILSYLYNDLKIGRSLGYNDFFGSQSFDFLPISEHRSCILFLL